jgi:phosphatidylglycerol---prolipoprotein diacylglyceryl transferase
MTWNIEPVIVQLGRFAISWYGLFFASGFFIGLQVMQWIYRREGRLVEELERLLWFVMAGTLIGMRLAHCFIYEPEYYLTHLWEVPQIWLGGYASHGGAAGLLLAVWLYCRKPERPNYLWLLDRLAIPAVLAGAFIRVGNFFNSEIVGEPTSSPFGIVFEQLAPEFHQPRHPVQLYEAVAYLIIFFVLFTLYRRLRTLKDGWLTGLYFVLVFSARFALEFFKTPQADYEQGMAIHVGQYLSLPFVLLGIVLMMRSRSATPATN